MALISFSLPADARVTLEVFDLSGRAVATLLRDVPFPAGRHAVEFRRRDLPVGMYLGRLRAGTLVTTRKLLVVR
jgi:hypothetical protein